MTKEKRLEKIADRILRESGYAKTGRPLKEVSQYLKQKKIVERRGY